MEIEIMEIVTTDSEHYTNIANAIRAKLEVDDSVKFKPSEMADAIRSINGINISINGEEFNGTLNLKSNGTINIKLNDLPYVFSDRTAIVWNNEIHFLGSTNMHDDDNKIHFKWNGNDYTNVGTLPFSGYSSRAIIHNNEIHMFGSYDSTYNKAHYKWNGNVWTSVSTLPYAQNQGADFISYKNKIHSFGLGNYKTQHLAWNGSSWTSLPNTIPYYNNCLTIYDDKIYIYGRDSDDNGQVYDYQVTWDDTSYTYNNTPFYAYCSSSVTYNNEIHILGGYNMKRMHYKWNGSTWTQIENLPYDFYSSTALVYNNEIHLLGGDDPNSGPTKNHYVLNKTTYVSS